jgi:DNA-directed RNA polymerase
MSKIDLKYYKSTKKQIKYQIDGIRYTKNHTVLTNEIDIKKIKTSIRANYVHIHDASVVQYILKIKPILTIHDCFMIDYLSITYLISLINEAMRVQYHDLKLNENFKNEKIFSIFIVI